MKDPDAQKPLDLGAPTKIFSTSDVAPFQIFEPREILTQKQNRNPDQQNVRRNEHRKQRMIQHHRDIMLTQKQHAEGQRRCDSTTETG
jgi:hypothetical protein